MFYWIFSAVFMLLVSVFCFFKFCAFKNSERFNVITNKTLKILTVAYCVLMLCNILLPDAFTLSVDKEVLAEGGLLQGYAVLRWFMCVPFVVLPIAVFFKNRTFKNIAVYFCTIVTIVSLAYYTTHLSFFTSVEGRGLNSIPVLSSGLKQFLLNPAFRSIYFGLYSMLQLLIPIVLAIQEKHVFDYKNLKEYGKFFLILPLVILSIVPIYVPQYLFGYTNIIFTRFSIVHFAWFGATILELVLLYLIFRNKDEDSKRILLFVLSLSLLLQYSQMFGAASISIKRLPLQLCNLGAFFILISLITKNKRIFNFTLIINVVGAIFALAMPDLDGEGLFYLYNMHFILEHTNVLIIPILALMFKMFPRLDRKALKDCIIGFSIYFIGVWALGTGFNAIATATNNDFYTANYMFMFLEDVAIEILPFTKALFDINFKVGYATFYPIIQLLVYVVFLLVCVGLYFAIRLIYKINDKLFKRKNNIEDAENS